MGFSIEHIVLRIPAILIALTVHEYAHGWVAYHLGDRTAYNAGRLTFNPIAHIDPIGSILPLFGLFGWAKPVPVDPRFFKNPKKGVVLVSGAGPLSNICLALLFGYLFRFVEAQEWSVSQTRLLQFLQFSFLINIGISFFNLIPIPPLDGSKILMGFLPERMIPGYFHKSRYVLMVIMVLIVAEWALGIRLFSSIIQPFFRPYVSVIQFLVFWKL